MSAYPSLSDSSCQEKSQRIGRRHNHYYSVLREMRCRSLAITITPMCRLYYSQYVVSFMARAARSRWSQRQSSEPAFHSISIQGSGSYIILLSKTHCFVNLERYPEGLINSLPTSSHILRPVSQSHLTTYAAQLRRIHAEHTIRC